MFQDGSRHHLGLSNSQNFIGWRCQHSTDASLYQFQQNWPFHCWGIAIFRFSKMPATAILDFWNREIVLALGVEMQHQAEFRQNQSMGYKDIKNFLFFKMAAAAILDCRIRKILLADGVRTAQTHHCTKFHPNRSFRCRDITIFLIFKIPAAAILDYWNGEIPFAVGVQWV